MCENFKKENNISPLMIKIYKKKYIVPINE